LAGGTAQGLSRYQLTPQAADDLFEIWSYIARDSVAAANRLEDAVYDACAFLAEGPWRGMVREEITQLPLRFWTVQAFPNYLIVYDPQSDPLQIIRILHGSRDLPATLGEATPET
jgi:plasmid stabilization system protein ParE